MSASSTALTTPQSAPARTYLYLYYIPICGGGYGDFGTGFYGDGGYVDTSVYNLSTPWGGTPGAPPSSPKASDISHYLPNATEIINGEVYADNSDQPFTLRRL